MTTPQFGIFRFVYAASVVVAPCFAEQVELNTVWNDNGEQRFTQVIYDTYQDSSRLAIADWHMADRCLSIVHTGLPEYPYTVLRQTDCGGVQKIRVRSVRYTDTFHDAEEIHREVLPVGERKSVLR